MEALFFMVFHNFIIYFFYENGISAKTDEERLSSYLSLSFSV